MKNKTKTTAPIRLPQEWIQELKRLPWLLLIPIGLALPALASRFPSTVERLYSRGFYPLLSGVLARVTGLFPFSIAEWLLYALVLGIPAFIIANLVRALLHRIGWRLFVHRMLTLAIAFGITLNSFYLLWGFHYARQPLGTQLALDVRQRPVQELALLSIELIQQAAILREQVQEDENGIFTLPDGTANSLRRIPDAYAALSRTVPQFSGYAARPKQPLLGAEGMSWAGIAGIYIPFTFEPNVNTHQSALLIPAAAAHESAHSLGIAREDEANFAAYLACLASDDTALQYSGVMLALIHATNELSRENPQIFSAIYELYTEGMLRDLRDYNAYWDKYEGPVEKTVNKMNDGYLKYNQQQSGVKSYGEMVDLLLAWREQRLS